MRHRGLRLRNVETPAGTAAARQRRAAQLELVAVAVIAADREDLRQLSGVDQVRAVAVPRRVDLLAQLGDLAAQRGDAAKKVRQRDLDRTRQELLAGFAEAGAARSVDLGL